MQLFFLHTLFVDFSFWEKMHTGNHYYGSVYSTANVMVEAFLDLSTLTICLKWFKIGSFPILCGGWICFPVPLYTETFKMIALKGDCWQHQKMITTAFQVLLDLSEVLNIIDHHIFHRPPFRVGSGWRTPYYNGCLSSWSVILLDERKKLSQRPFQRFNRLHSGKAINHQRLNINAEYYI